MGKIALDEVSVDVRWVHLALVEHLAPADVLGQLLPQPVVGLLPLQDHVVQVLGGGVVD